MIYEKKDDPVYMYRKKIADSLLEKDLDALTSEEVKMMLELATDFGDLLIYRILQWLVSHHEQPRVEDRDRDKA